MVRFLVIIISLIIVTTFLCSFPARSQDYEDYGKKEASIQGDVFSACLAAYSDFSKVLKEKSKNTSETAQISSKLENYNIMIFSKNDRYLVRFSINHDKFPYIKGGGVDYIIDKRSYDVLEKIGWR